MVDRDIVIEDEVQRMDAKVDIAAGKGESIDTREDAKPESASEMASIEATELKSLIHVVKKGNNATKLKLGTPIPSAFETIEMVDKKETPIVSGQSSNSTIGSSETKPFEGIAKILADGKGNKKKTLLKTGRFQNKINKMNRPHLYRKIFGKKGENDAVAVDTKEDAKSEFACEMAAIESIELKSQIEGEKDAIALDTKEDAKPESASEMTAVEATKPKSLTNVVKKESNSTKLKLGTPMPGAFETIEMVDKMEMPVASGQSSNSTIGFSEKKPFEGSAKVLTDGKGKTQTSLNKGKFQNKINKMRRPDRYRKIFEKKGENDAVAVDTKEDAKSEFASEMAAIESIELKSQIEGEKDAFTVDTKEDAKSEFASEMTATELKSVNHVVKKESNATKLKLGTPIPGAFETIEMVDKMEMPVASGQSSNSSIGSSETKPFEGSAKILADGKGNKKKALLKNGRFQNKINKMRRPDRYRKIFEKKGENDAVAVYTKEDAKSESATEMATIESIELKSQIEEEIDAVAVDTKGNVKSESASEMAAIESIELKFEIEGQTDAVAVDAKLDVKPETANESAAAKKTPLKSGRFQKKIKKIYEPHLYREKLYNNIMPNVDSILH
ncbi:hypothetical protein ACOME3_006473 [Neoechinorhynchus agilis]